MTLATLALWIGGAAIIYTLLVKFLLKKEANLLLVFLQGFCGALFIVSGFVKAIDPMGTAFKMQQYFAEFQQTFKGSFIENIFPWFSQHAEGFSIFIVSFEIVLGLMLLLGARTRIVAWLFFLLVVFFLFLTGFTFLTGYVPSGVNFFEFSKWGAYEEANMKVTDCGCFGDFLKLKPYVSFQKDLVLLIPAIIFLFYSKRLVILFGRKFRTALVWIGTIASLLFCYANSYWNEPPVDFRPFKVGVNIREQKKLEEEAQANVEIKFFVMKNKTTGEVKNVAYDDYMKNFKAYPSDTWETIKQIKTEPAIEHSKISDFEFNNADGFPYAEDFIAESSGYVVMVLSYHLDYDDLIKETLTRMDTVWTYDTLKVNRLEILEGKQVTNTVDSLVPKAPVVNEIKEEKITGADWDETYVSRLKYNIIPFANDAIKEGWKVIGITNPVESNEVITDLKKKVEANFDFYTTDDLVLKTIMRSNPGILILHNGKIVAKYHHLHVPAFAKAKAAVIE